MTKMGKYIDRAKLFNSLANVKTIGEAFAAIQDAPAEDVEKVVRCKDCKYLDYVDEYEKWCMGRGYPATMVKDDGYCEIGKRKEES